MEQEQAAWNHAGGFHYRLQITFMKINQLRTNYDPDSWYKEMRVLETETNAKLNVKENDPTIKQEDKYDKWWYEEYKKIHGNVRKEMSAYNELTNDNVPDEMQGVEISEAKQKTFEPLDQMHKHLLRLVWKKGWAMPEAEEWGKEMLG